MCINHATFVFVRVLINTIGMLPAAENAAQAWCKYMLADFIAAYPAYSFLILAADSHEIVIPSFPQVTMLKLRPPALPALRKLWFQYVLPAKQKSFRAAVVLQATGNTWRTFNVPQISLLHDYRHPALSNQKAWQQMMRNAIKHADHLLTFTQSFAAIVKEYDLSEKHSLEYIAPIPSGIAEPLTEAEKQLLKQNFTDGMEYLLCCDAGQLTADELKMLLKAYARFKKKQHTGMKLLLLGTEAHTNALSGEIDAYRYRNDLVFLKTPEPSLESQLIATAYAVVDISNAQHPRWQVFNAGAAGVPVLAPRSPVFEAMDEAAFVFYTPNHIEDLAAKMMLLYKDETLRSQYINKLHQLVYKQLDRSLLVAFDAILMKAAKRL